jgi:hypothetical protein
MQELPRYNPNNGIVVNPNKRRVTLDPYWNIQVLLQYIEGGKGHRLECLIPTHLLIPFKDRLMQMWATDKLSVKLELMASIVKDIEQRPRIK